jgi:protein-S-isoprenylcysteine O-methyltransferase Ste14
MDARDWDWKTWAVFIIVTVIITALCYIILDGQKNEAQACAAHGGQWIEYAKDYYTCAEAK